jgi:hypothetical protein
MMNIADWRDVPRASAQDALDAELRALGTQVNTLLDSINSSVSTLEAVRQAQALRIPFTFAGQAGAPSTTFSFGCGGAAPASGNGQSVLGVPEKRALVGKCAPPSTTAASLFASPDSPASPTAVTVQRRRFRSTTRSRQQRSEKAPADPSAELQSASLELSRAVRSLHAAAEARVLALKDEKVTFYVEMTAAHALVRRLNEEHSTEVEKERERAAAEKDAVAKTHTSVDQSILLDVGG